MNNQKRGKSELIHLFTRVMTKASALITCNTTYDVYARFIHALDLLMQQAFLIRKAFRQGHH